MHVLHVSSGLDPRTGGTATAAIQIALAARRVGLDVTLAYPTQEDEAELIQPALDRLAEAGVTTEGFPFGQGARAKRWGISPALNRWLAAEAGRFDAVHTHSAWVWSSVAATRAARRAGKRAILMPHEALTRHDIQGSRLQLVKQLLKGWYGRNIDRFAFTSGLEARDSLLADDSRARVIGLPAVDETLPASAEPPDRQGPPVVGYLGRFHPKKNLDLLIRAVGHSADARLVIAGGGEDAYSAEVRSLADRLSLGDRVDWLGFLTVSGKPAFFQSIDALVVPSSFECFGLVAAEALAHHVPVILSPTVGVAEDLHAEGVGLIVPPRPDALAVAISKLRDRAQLAEWRVRCRRVALARYSYKAFGQRLVELYSD
ncbi:MAG: glycosyltransferase family 4 protein [Alphaproteobacteria bacterium]|nr:glycosyltransferase family 4 protein [Alphaproteobacteria bacterium]